MTEDEVFAFLEGRSPALADGYAPTLAFDTNTIFGNTKSDPGVELIDAINRANQRRGGAPEVGLVVPSVVLHEKIRQMAQRFGGRFDVEQPRGFLRAKNLRVESFGESHAIQVALRLQQRFPTHGDWRAFKKRRCLQGLGLPVGTFLSRDGSDCGATVDWLIVGHAEADGYLLVTNDSGPEFAAVTLRASLPTTLAAAQRLVSVRNA